MGQYASLHTGNRSRQTNGWTDGQIYMQTDVVEWGNVTASSWCPAHSLPVNPPIAEQSPGSQPDRLYTYYTNVAGNRLLHAQPPQAARDMKAGQRKKGQRKENQFLEQMQVSRKAR